MALEDTAYLGEFISDKDLKTHYEFLDFTGFFKKKEDPKIKLYTFKDHENYEELNDKTGLREKIIVELENQKDKGLGMFPSGYKVKDLKEKREEVQREINNRNFFYWNAPYFKGVRENRSKKGKLMSAIGNAATLGAIYYFFQDEYLTSSLLALCQGFISLASEIPRQESTRPLKLKSKIYDNYLRIYKNFQNNIANSKLYIHTIDNSYKENPFKKEQLKNPDERDIDTLNDTLKSHYTEMRKNEKHLQNTLKDLKRTRKLLKRT